MIVNWQHFTVRRLFFLLFGGCVEASRRPLRAVANGPIWSRLICAAHRRVRLYYYTPFDSRGTIRLLVYGEHRQVARSFTAVSWIPEEATGGTFRAGRLVPVRSPSLPTLESLCAGDYG